MDNLGAKITTNLMTDKKLDINYKKRISQNSNTVMDIKIKEILVSWVINENIHAVRRLKK
jgi:hypothetical protein